jgi:integrase
VRGRLEKILGAERVAGHRSAENPARWKGHLEHLLPARSKVRKASKHPALPWELIPSFMSELRAMPGIVPRCLDFCVLTASRAGETRGMVWGEVVGDVWTVPGSCMKAGIEHRVPLSRGSRPSSPRWSEQARRSRVCGRPRRPGAGRVGFEGRACTDERAARQGPTGAVGRSQAERRPDLCAWLQVIVSRLGSRGDRVRRLAGEAALAHASGDKVEAAYKRGDALAKRRKLMEAWAAYCSGEACLPQARCATNHKGSRNGQSQIKARRRGGAAAAAHKRRKKFTAAYAPLIAAHETLTRPDLEDWLLVADGDTIHCAAFQESTAPGALSRCGKRHFISVKCGRAETRDINEFSDREQGRSGSATPRCCRADCKRGVQAGTQFQPRGARNPPGPACRVSP